MKKIFTFTLLLTCLVAACSTLPTLVLKYNLRRYRPCADAEIKLHRPEWKGNILFCWRYCAKYKTWRKHISKNCVSWKTNILDTQEDFYKLRAGGFVLINEERID